MRSQQLPALDEDGLAGATPEQIYSVIFSEVVMGYGHTALLLLGKIPNAEDGTVNPPEPESAKSYIDILEMLLAKTRGNLSPEETQLLTRTLEATRGALAEVFDAAWRSS
jgi:hypothetical protein